MGVGIRGAASDGVKNVSVTNRFSHTFTYAESNGEAPAPIPFPPFGAITIS
jgi:hypothetical protein